MIYLDCDNHGCDGEYPFDVEETDDGADGIYGSTSYLVAWLDRVTNRTSHREECPGLAPSDERIDALEEQATEKANDPTYGYRASRAEAWAELGL